MVLLWGYAQSCPANLLLKKQNQKESRWADRRYSDFTKWWMKCEILLLSSLQRKCSLRKIKLGTYGFTWFCCFLQSFREDFSLLLPPFAETMNQTCSEWSLVKRSCATTKEISLFVISFQISWLNCNVSVSVCAGFCINLSEDQQLLLTILFLGRCWI